MTAQLNTLDIEYYGWLVGQVDIHNGKTFGELFELMHNTEFVWTIQGDDSRVADGLYLRNEFTDSQEPNLNLGGATFLEVLIGLSRRVAFIAGNTEHAPEWAWTLIKNLRLYKYSDPMSAERRANAEDKLQAVIWRTYREDGLGGFFPLQNPSEDQTKVEIWYQMNAYVNEMTDL